MNVVDTLRELWRRWYIVLPGVVLTLSLAVGAWYAVSPDYERSATQLLVPGANSIPEGANPYLFLGGLSPATDVVVRAVGSENALNAVAERYPDVKIDISRDTSTAGPVILIEVTAASDATARQVLGILVDQTATVLNDIQEAANVAGPDRLTVMPITIDTESVVQQRDRYIAVVGIGLGGVALTLVLASLVEGLSRPRRRSTVTPDSRATTLVWSPESRNPTGPRPSRLSPVFDQTSHHAETGSAAFPRPGAR